MNTRQTTARAERTRLSRAGGGSAADVGLAVLTAGLAIAGVGCRASHSPRPPGPVASALVALAANLGDTPEGVARAWPVLDELAALIDVRRGGPRAGAVATVEAMNAVVFQERGFEREIVDDDPRFFRLSSVLTERRGSCLGLGALYLALAERLDTKLDGLMVPGHFFVRAPATAGVAARNVELLRRGEAMPDAWYRQKYGPWPERPDDYFRPLSVAELEAVHWFNLGNHLRGKGALDGAERAYRHAVAAFPDFAEAHASLGVTRQLAGRLDAAADAYAAAARLRPDLPGLAQNLDRLDEARTADKDTPQTRRYAP